MVNSMNIRDLKYLVSLVDHQHFGKAAEACFVTQPALSMQIQKLEDVLGIKLLERTNKSLLFTEEGLMIAERARKILSQVDEIYDFAKLSKDPYSGEIKVGIFPTLAPYFLPMIIPMLTKKYNKLSFYLMEEQTQSLINKLKEGQLSAAFLTLPLAEKNIKTIPLFEEEFVLAVPHQHPLANYKMIRQHHLDNKELLLLEEGHCMREQALSFCQSIHANESQNFRATSIETLRHMVAAGIGITLIPKLACDNNKNISYIPFELPKPVRSICLAWRDTTPKHNLLLEMATYLKKSILPKQNNLKIV